MLPFFTNAKLAISIKRKYINTKDIERARQWARLDFETIFYILWNSKHTPITKDKYITWIYRKIYPKLGGIA